MRQLLRDGVRSALLLAEMDEDEHDQVGEEQGRHLESLEPWLFNKYEVLPSGQIPEAIVKLTVFL